MRLVGYETHKLVLGTGPHGPEWLEIRNRLSYAERQRLQSAILDIDFQDDGTRSMKADPGRYSVAVLAAYIQGWQLFDDEGGRVPFSVEALERLDEETASAAIDHIDGLTATGAGGATPAVYEATTATDPKGPNDMNAPFTVIGLPASTLP